MKLILVDDEKGIVEGLKKMISRYIPECEVVGSAHNGLEGFELIQKKQPDIVITDIRMPQADGLDMINMLREANSRAEFILLSGYADFEYARKGIQLGVKFYLNKPVEEEELRQCVIQVMDAISSNRDKLAEVDELRQEVLSRIQEDALRDISYIGPEQADLMEELLQAARIPKKCSRFASILMEFDGNTDPLKENGFQPLYQQIDLALRRYHCVYRFRYSAGQIAIVVAHGAPMKNEELIRMVRVMKEAALRELKLSVTVGIGKVHDGVTGISKSFEEARQALSYKVIKGTDAVLPYFEMLKLAGPGLSVPEEVIAKLEAAIDNMDKEECTRILRDIFRLMEDEPDMRPDELQMHCLNILLSSIRKISFQQLQQNDFLGRHILSLEGISKFRTLEVLEEWMIEIIDRMITFKQEHNNLKKNDIITQVKEYVAAHYDEPITLADLSARFFISPYYLSKYFKQKTGETYVSFLTQIRIAKAKELLKQTDLKVYEICRMVGYSDTQHFAQMFEKLAGCKPRDYRKLLPNA
ncbi:response regulator [Paenibacillus sp. LPE1-1-1.1]|uniref:response regulator n=1 Tax=Paenibacillus sp. LPE1-1-1.1 TaxID=3135230 RepID=UPI0034392F3E